MSNGLARFDGLESAFENTQYGISVRSGSIEFQGYDELRRQAIALSDLLNQITITEETAKDGKRLVAKVRSVLKGLDSERKAVRESFMRPVNDLDDRIRGIEQIVNESEQRLRDQLAVIESERKEKKRAEIKRIFDLRADRYRLETASFGDFIKPRHLNKTFSMNKVESEMVNYFEGLKQEKEAFETHIEEPSREDESQEGYTLDFRVTFRDEQEEQSLIRFLRFLKLPYQVFEID